MLVRKSQSSLLRLAHKPRVFRDPSSFSPPIIAHDAVYVGGLDEELVKLDWATVQPQWRVPAEGFQFVDSYRDVLLLDSFHTARYRGMRPDGSVAWTLEPMGSIGWGRWNDHLYAIGPDIGMVLADPVTGRPLGPNALGLRRNDVPKLCEDVVLLQDRNGDPFRAYHLKREQFLWERNLLADLTAKYGVRDRRPLLRIKSSGPGLCVCTREEGIYGFNLENGELLWGFSVVARALDAYRSRIYVWTGSPDRGADRFLCLDAATGALIYDVPATSHDFRFGVFSERHIAYVERSGFIALFQLSDGGLAWSYQRACRLRGAVIEKNRLFVHDEDGRLLVFEGDI